jgi:hypothetical protein
MIINIVTTEARPFTAACVEVRYPTKYHLTDLETTNFIENESGAKAIELILHTEQKSHQNNNKSIAT